VKDKLLSVTRFLRITDFDDNLSITNLLLITISVKLVLMPVIDPLVVIGLIAALTQYAHKRHITTKAKDESDVIVKQASQEIEKLGNKVTQTVEDVNQRLKDNEENLEHLQIKMGFKKSLGG